MQLFSTEAILACNSTRKLIYSSIFRRAQLLALWWIIMRYCLWYFIHHTICYYYELMWTRKSYASRFLMHLSRRTQSFPRRLHLIYALLIFRFLAFCLRYIVLMNAICLVSVLRQSCNKSFSLMIIIQAEICMLPIHASLWILVSRSYENEK